MGFRRATRLVVGDSGVDERAWMRVRARGAVVLGEVKAVEVREWGVEDAGERGPSESKEEGVAVTGDSMNTFLKAVVEL